MAPSTSGMPNLFMRPFCSISGNRSLTVAALKAHPSRDRQGAVALFRHGLEPQDSERIGRKSVSELRTQPRNATAHRRHLRRLVQSVLILHTGGCQYRLGAVRGDASGAVQPDAGFLGL